MALFLPCDHGRDLNRLQVLHDVQKKEAIVHVIYQQSRGKMRRLTRLLLLGGYSPPTVIAGWRGSYNRASVVCSRGAGVVGVFLDDR